MTEELGEEVQGVKTYIRVLHHLAERTYALKRKRNIPAAVYYMRGLEFLMRRFTRVWSRRWRRAARHLPDSEVASWRG